MTRETSPGRIELLNGVPASRRRYGYLALLDHLEIKACKAIGASCGGGAVIPVGMRRSMPCWQARGHFGERWSEFLKTAAAFLADDAGGRR
jgi:hypothetical protein